MLSTFLIIPDVHLYFLNFECAHAEWEPDELYTLIRLFVHFGDAYMFFTFHKYSLGITFSVASLHTFFYTAPYMLCTTLFFPTFFPHCNSAQWLFFTIGGIYTFDARSVIVYFMYF